MTPTRPFAMLALATLALAVLAPARAAERQPKQPREGTDASRRTGDAIDGRFTIHFEDVELPVFVKFISRATGRNFVFAEKVSGNVTVVSPNPVTAEEAYAVFESVLSVRGLTTIDDGVVTRVVPLKEARTAGAAVIQGDSAATGFATRLLPLRHVGSQDVAEVLEPLVSKEGALVAYAATNTVIATDTVTNLTRMAEVVAALDVPGNQQSVAVIPLEHAQAQTVAEHITTILSEQLQRTGTGAREKNAPAQQQARTAFKIVADARMNALVVTADGLEMRKIRDLASQLDKPLRAGGERIHVYYARFADAGDLVAVLENTLTGTRRRGAARGTDGGGGAARGSSTGTAPSLSEDISVSADLPTNAVIVAASSQDFQTVRTLLEGLDIPRPQVFVEAIVAEVSITKARDLGLEFQAGGDVGDGTLVVRSNLSVLNAALNPALLGGIGGLLAAATSDKTIELPDGTEIPAQVAVIRALAEDRDVEILSAPTLLTLDNEEAEILVGQNVPFVTGQGVDVSSVSNVFTTVERQDIGIKLRIRPQVSEGDMVILEVEEEVSALVPNPLLDADQVGPTTTVRSAKTTVSVADGHTAVIGGLIADSLQRRDSKVPILGDIPFLGRLFRVDADMDEKVNLLVILTPHIIRNKDDLTIVSEQKRRRYQQGIPEPQLNASPLAADVRPMPLPGLPPNREEVAEPTAPADSGARYIIPSRPPRGS